jgi:23S rRNA (uracil1939-C5)-methyltransferase
MPGETSTYEVELTSFAYGGEVLGRLPDRRAVFVPFALPGEKVRIRLVEERRGYARAELLEVLSTAPGRTTPRCAHFGTCGNCHYQHIDYPAQLQAKTAILRDQLERIGRLENPPVLPIVPSPDPYYYRNNVQFHLTQQGQLGYHKFRSTEVFTIRECHLPEHPLNQVWPQLDFEPVPGLVRIGIRMGAGEDFLLTLESQDPEIPDYLVEEIPVSIVFLSPENTAVLAGSSYIIMEVLGREFRVSAGSFFQVHSRMAELMVDHILSHVSPTPSDTVMDIYAGVGLFSAFLAPKVLRLVGIESSPSACDDFAINLDEFDHVELYEGAAEEILPALDIQPRLVVADPPRAGIERHAMDGLLALEPETLVYVSCDPATLARDARRLVEGGYRLEQVTPFDLFPQTFHIESISFWNRA